MANKPGAGRPSKYSDQIADKVYDYLGGFVPEEGQVPSIPTLEGFALFVGIVPSTLHKWRKEEGKEKFSEALEYLLAQQKQMLLHYGLLGSYNSTLAKLILSANHGVSETVKNDHSSSDGTFAPTRVELVPLKE